MDVSEAIKARRSVRSYLPDPIPLETLLKVMEAARLSPSALNLQPWHFIIVTDALMRKKLSVGMFAKFLANVPVVIVGCGNRVKSPVWYIVDTTIALQSMVLAATGEHLGTCWIGSFDGDEVKALLNIPDEYDVVALIALGYPKNKEDILRRALSTLSRTKPLQDIVSLENYGNPFNYKP